MGRVIAGVLVAFGLVASAQADLQPPVNGQVYDDVLGISWLQDANLIRSLCVSDPDGLWANWLEPDPAVPNNSGRTKAEICADNGSLNWYEAEAWIAYLNANNYLGVDTWRQWAVPNPTNDPSCSDQDADAAGSDWGLRCTGSELGHLFNSAVPDGLGNPNDLDDNCFAPPGTGPDHCLQNTGPFTNLQFFFFWSGTEYAPDPADAWFFLTDDGLQRFENKFTSALFVWPVHPGQAAATIAVPALPVWGLVLMGLLLAGLARRWLR